MKRVRFEFASRREQRGGNRALAAPHPEFVAPGPTEFTLLRQDPPLSDEDEAILLLHTAAEVEHSLLVEYLYAAYSLPESGLEGQWRDTLIGIAREEMAHLIGVQNVLLALAGPLNFEREDYPFRTFYPFPFQLVPFSLKSAARYVLAEMPDPSVIPAGLGFDLAQVQTDAELEPDALSINRVGLLYAKLVEIVGALDPSVFHVDSEALQADPREWVASAFNFVLDLVPTRDRARDLLFKIGEQGEGPTEPAQGLPSHFRRFFTIYQQLKQRGGSPGLSVPTNPTTVDDQSPGYIGHAQGRQWAHLMNVRYRSLLALLAHYLSLRRDLPAEKPLRNQLRTWAREEMIWLRDGAHEVTQFPQHDPPQHDPQGNLKLAAVPFELPYSLSLPQRQVDRWRHHRMLARHSRALIADLLGAFPASMLLSDLDAWEADRLAVIEPLTHVVP